MFARNNNKTANTTSKLEKAVKTFNTRNAITTAAHKLSNVGYATAVGGGTVVAGTCYYSANSKRMSRKEKKQLAKINNTACGVAIVGAGVGTVAKLVEGIAQPMPFDQAKYLADMTDDDFDEVAEAEAEVESHIENEEGAEQNAQ